MGVGGVQITYVRYLTGLTLRSYGARTFLTERMWARLEPLLPSEQGGMGRPCMDNRPIVEAILWKHRTGAPWRDLPESFELWNRSSLASIGGTGAVSGSGSSKPFEVRRIVNGAWSMAPSSAPTSMPLVQRGDLHPSPWALTRRLFDQGPPDRLCPRQSRGLRADARPVAHEQATRKPVDGP
jgi:hypothetical protein